MAITDPASALTALDAAALQPFREAWQKVEESTWATIGEGLSAVAQTHLELMETYGISGEPPAPDAWQSLAEYRRRAAAEVQGPFLGLLRATDPMVVVRDALSGAEQRSWELGSTLESGAVLPWDEAGLERRDSDAVGRRLGKALVRGGHAMRKKTARPEVPLGHLAHHVLRVQAIPAQRAAFEEAQRAWAQWTGALERDWDAWAACLLAPLGPARDPGQEVAANEGADEGPPEGAAKALAATVALQEALDRALAGPPHREAMSRGLEALTQAVARFGEELPLAGTAALRLGSDPAPPPPAKVPSGPTWPEWFGHALNRFELHGSMLQVVLGSEDAVRGFEVRLGDYRGGDLTPSCSDGAAGLRRLAGTLKGGPGLAAALSKVRPEAQAQVSSALASLPDLLQFESGVASAANTMSEAIHGLTRAIPSELAIHALPPSGAPLAKPTEARPVKLQEVARRTFDVLRMEKIRTSPLPLLQRLTDLAAEAEGTHDVVAFGLESAEGELDAGEEDATERALTLARDGLERAADALDDLPKSVDRVIRESSAAVESEVARGWGRLVDRGLAQGVQSQLLDARSTLRHQFGEFRERWTPAARRISGRVRSVWTSVRASVGVLVRRGRTMVGASGSARAGYREAKVLAESDALYATLPLVYQRLYSLRPVVDPALLVARDALLSEIEERCRTWRDEHGVPLVLFGHPGVGVSSLFLVLVERLRAQGTQTVHLTLAHRYRGESALAADLAAAMGLPPAESLEALGTAILGAGEGDLPDVMAVEGLEHVYLRTPGGTDLIERLLTFLSETEPRVFWVASATHAAWQLVRKAEPSAVSQVDQIEVVPLDYSEVRQAILARHRRSGVPMEYEEPKEGRHLLRRRLRRIQGSEARRQILEQDFFEKLHDASGGNIRLALYHWLRAADFAAVPGELRIRPVESVDFSFLDGLDLTQNFTLKAMLEHRTLTLEDHDAIFRLPRQESFQIMESLMNRFLVEPVRDPGGEDRASGAGEDHRRYRILPLLAGAVSAHLAGRNIVH